MRHWHIAVLVAAGAGAAAALVATFVAKKQGWIKFDFDPLEWAKSFWKTYAVKPTATSERAEKPKNVVDKIQDLLHSATALCADESYTEALPIFKEILQLLSKESFGTETMLTGFVRIELGIVLRELGQYENAVAELEKAVKHFRSVTSSTTEEERLADAKIQYIRASCELIDCLCLFSAENQKNSYSYLQTAKERLKEILNETRDCKDAQDPQLKFLYSRSLYAAAEVYYFLNEISNAEKYLLLSLGNPPVQKDVLALKVWFCNVLREKDQPKIALGEVDTMIKLDREKEFDSLFANYCGEVAFDFEDYVKAATILGGTFASAGGALGTFVPNKEKEKEMEKKVKKVPLVRLPVLMNYATVLMQANETQKAVLPLLELEFLLTKHKSVPLTSSKFFKTKSLSCVANSKGLVGSFLLAVRQRKSVPFPANTILQICVLPTAFAALSESEAVLLLSDINAVDKIACNVTEIATNARAKTYSFESAPIANPLGFLPVAVRVISTKRDVVYSVHFQFVQ